MTEFLQSLDPAQFAAMKGGDEKVLIALFRTHYETLVSKAREALGPDIAHFSGRVAIQSTLDTWQRRATISNAAGFTSTWEQAIREEAALQARRHAAVRQHETSKSASHVSIPNVDDAVAQLTTALHPPVVDHDKVMAEAVAARRHHAAGGLNKVAGESGKGWKGPALVLGGLAVVIIAGMQWLNATGGDHRVNKALTSEDARHLQLARGQRGNVTLADSSIAQIGSESQLTLPSEFGVTMRTLLVEGTAAFSVAPGQEMPFSVRAYDNTITATGTKFAVRAYDDDSSVVVGVDEGTVNVQTKENKKGTAVAAGETIRITHDGSITPMDANGRAMALGWTTDTLTFIDTPVKVVMAELSRFFDLKASLADPALGDRPLSLRIPLGSSGDALNAMTQAADLVIGFDKDDKVVLSAKPVDSMAGAKKK